MRTAEFAAVFVALFAAHQVADHWIQTGHQAATKGEPGWPGRVACAGHVAGYLVTQAVFLALAVASTGMHLRLASALGGLAVSGLTHYWADRRTTLSALASTVERLGLNGKRDYHDAGGAFHLDQSWHVGWLFVAALLSAVGAS